MSVVVPAATYRKMKLQSQAGKGILSDINKFAKKHKILSKGLTTFFPKQTHLIGLAKQHGYGRRRRRTVRSRT